MKKYRRLTDKDKVDIIEGYTSRLETMIDLATAYGVTRQAIYKCLKAAGIDTSKEAANMPVSCSCCGVQFTRKRCQVRKAKHLFCSEECYFAWLGHGNGNPLVIHRQASRIARKVISELFALTPAMIVHHKDRNQNNNTLPNLMVFAGQGDHVRHHRGFLVPVLFDGAVPV